MVAVRSFWLAQPGLSGSASVNHFFAVDHVVSSECADLVLSLRTTGRARETLERYGLPLASSRLKLRKRQVPDCALITELEEIDAPLVLTDWKSEHDEIASQLLKPRASSRSLLTRRRPFHPLVPNSAISIANFWNMAIRLLVNSTMTLKISTGDLIAASFAANSKANCMLA
jgi:hypothetical protein